MLQANGGNPATITSFECSQEVNYNYQAKCHLQEDTNSSETISTTKQEVRR